MNERIVEANGVDLAVAEAGEGGRPILLVHGFCGAKEDFTEHLDDMAALGWHAVAPDLRGHGASGHPSGEAAYDFDTFVADLVALADGFGWSRFALLGHAMGGMLAQLLVLEHPDRVAALILMSTSHGMADTLDAADVAIGASIVREHGLLTLLALQNERRERDPRATPAQVRLRRERPDYAEFADRKLLACSPDMWVSMTAKFVVQRDRLDALAAVEVPTLVVVGEQDEPHVGHSERMAKVIPHGRLAVIPSAGHAPQFENPDAWWAAVSQFLEEV